MASGIQDVNLVEKLLSSFVALEHAIQRAKNSLSTKPSVPREVIERLESYGGILEKQRNLTLELSEHIDKGNMLEVARHVGLINGLSGMIIDDARSILASFSEDEVMEVTEEEFSDFC